MNPSYKENKLQIVEKKTTSWSSKNKCLLALICWTVGIGNCWKAFSSDGAVFLIPYIIMVVIFAIPYTFMEIGIGQYSNKNSVDIWDMCPIFRGVGYSSVLMMVFLIIYYNLTNTLLLHYTWASMSTELPWSKCDPSWARVNCFTHAENISIHFNCNQKYGKEYCDELEWEESVVHYWRMKVLQKGENLKGVNYTLMLNSGITTFLVFLINVKATRSIEKVLWFLTLYPYFSLIVYLLVTLADPGCGIGIHKYITLEFKNLIRNGLSWVRALEQVIFSMGFGFGGLINIGSHGQFRYASHRLSIAVNLIDFASSIFFGLIFYICLGIVSYHINKPLINIVRWDVSGLFVKIPLAITFLPGVPQLWAIIFFSGIYVLSLRSQILMVHSLLNIICQKYQKLMKHSMTCSFICCMILFLLGFPLLIRAWIDIYHKLYEIVAGPCTLLIIFLESIGIMWFYSFTVFVDDLHFMLGFRPSPYWQLCWLNAPFVLFIMLVISVVYNLKTIKEYRKFSPYEFGAFGLVLAIIFITTFSLMVWRKLKKHDKLTGLLKPTKEWGPTDPVLKKSREMFSSHSMTKEYMYRQYRLKNKAGDDEESSSSDETY